MTHIAGGDMAFHPHSFADPLGRLFSWNGELYRAISPEAAAAVQVLLANPLVVELMRQGRIIETTHTNLSTDGYPLIVHQRRIPFVSYPHEWPIAMFRDACLLMIDVCIELLGGGYTLKDGHPWNVVFDSPNAVFVDVMSIVPLMDRTRWPAYDEFYRFCLGPLLLMAHGKGHIARVLLPTYEGVTRQDVSLLTNEKRSRPNHVMPWSIRRFARRKYVDDVFRELRAEIVGIAPPRSNRTTATPVTPEVARFMDHALAELKPDSVLVLRDRNLVLQAARQRHHVVAFHIRPEDATDLYDQARAEQLRIVPLVLDFTIPTPATGLLSHWLIAATDRLKCDVALAPGLVEELVFTRRLTFPQMSHGIAGFCKRAAVVEFSRPPQQRAAPPWYTPEGLAAALEKYFSKITINRGGDRAFIVCEDSRVTHG